MKFKSLLQKLYLTYSKNVSCTHIYNVFISMEKKMGEKSPTSKINPPPHCDEIHVWK